MQGPSNPGSRIDPPPDFAITTLIANRKEELDENRVEEEDGVGYSSLAMTPRELLEAGLEHIQVHMQAIENAANDMDSLHHAREGLRYFDEVTDDLNCVAGESMELAKWAMSVHAKYRASLADEN